MLSKQAYTHGCVYMQNKFSKNKISVVDNNHYCPKKNMRSRGNPCGCPKSLGAVFIFAVAKKEYENKKRGRIS